MKGRGEGLGEVSTMLEATAGLSIPPFCAPKPMVGHTRLW